MMEKWCSVIGHIFEGHIAGTTITSFSTMSFARDAPKKAAKEYFTIQIGNASLAQEW